MCQLASHFHHLTWQTAVLFFIKIIKKIIINKNWKINHTLQRTCKIHLCTGSFIFFSIFSITYRISRICWSRYRYALRQLCIRFSHSVRRCCCLPDVRSPTLSTSRIWTLLSAPLFPLFKQTVVLTRVFLNNHYNGDSIYGAVPINSVSSRKIVEYLILMHLRSLGWVMTKDRYFAIKTYGYGRKK